jgi:hypothetical protein
MNKPVTMSALLLLAGCQQQSQPANEAAPPAPAEAPAPSEPASPPAPAAPAPPTAPNGLPDNKAPLDEPNGPIDPKSGEAAGQVVQQYGALIEQKRFAEAEKLWNDAAAAKRMTQELKIYSAAHLLVGKPFDMEGAAGSSYISVPVVLDGRLESHAIRHSAGTAVLRRVNDVPGSTEAQRRWHIERIEWKA